MGQLLPILKPSGYRENDNLFFKERVFESSASPIIAYGTDQGMMIAYEIASNEEDYKNRLPSLKQQALDNLKTIQPQIDIQSADGSKIAFISGEEYACEKILDVEFMKAVSEKVGSNSLMVGIPFKGNLVATDANAKIRLKFPVIIKKYFDNPQQAPITDKVFLVNNGEIVAMAGDEINDEQSENFVITELPQTNNYKVEVKSKSIEELTENVNSSFQQIMAMVMARKVFGGEIAYYIGSTMTLNSELINKCQGYVSQIEKNEMAQTLIQALTKSGTRLVFYYKNKQIAPKQDDSNFDNPNGKKWWQFWK